MSQDPLVEFFRDSFTVYERGVLNAREDIRGNFEAGVPPSERAAVVDPCTTRFVRGEYGKGKTLLDCKGASGAIYKWANLRHFPMKMKSELREDGDVSDNIVWVKGPGAGHKKHHIFHVVSPLLKRMTLTPADAIDVLAPCYRNLFELFVSSRDCTTLRLCPLASNINVSNDLRPHMAHITLGAIEQAFVGMDGVTQNLLVNKNVRLCIYMEKELHEYANAHNVALEQARLRAQDSARSARPSGYQPATGAAAVAHSGPDGYQQWRGGSRWGDQRWYGRDRWASSSSSWQWSGSSWR